MGLEYGGLVPGPDPTVPLEGKVPGSGTVTLEIHPSGRVKADDGAATKVTDGAPTDADFDVTPPNGTLAVDGTNNAIYVRIGGSWLSVGVA